jgi:hypothetical protein
MTAQKAETPPDAMLEYARMFWPVHCKLSGEKNRVVPPLQPPISSFIMQRRVSAKFSMWMEDARRLTKSLSMEDPLRQKLCHCFCSPPNPFFLACVFGLEEVVEHSTVPTPDRCEPGHGGLHLASMYGHDQVVRILLGKGTDVNSGDTYGRTPLFYATKHAHANVVRVLLDYDKGIEITPEILIEAAISSREKKEDKTILELLLDRAGQAYISEEIVEIAVSKYFFCFIISFSDSSHECGSLIVIHLWLLREQTLSCNKCSTPDLMIRLLTSFKRHLQRT